MDDEGLTDEERYLLSSQANADRLRRSLAATERGEYVALSILFAELSRDVPLSGEEISLMDELRRSPG